MDQMNFKRFSSKDSAGTVHVFINTTTGKYVAGKIDARGVLINYNEHYSCSQDFTYIGSLDDGTRDGSKTNAFVMAYVREHECYSDFGYFAAFIKEVRQHFGYSLIDALTYIMLVLIDNANDPAAMGALRGRRPYMCGLSDSQFIQKLSEEYKDFSLKCAR